MRNLIKCNSDFMNKSRLAEPSREVNVTIMTIALPVACFLIGIAMHNSMGLAAKLGYFRIFCRKI